LPRTLTERLRIHRRAKALLAAWDESKHPRDEDGEFVSGGGGDGDDSSPAAASLSGRGKVLHSKDMVPTTPSGPTRKQIIEDPTTGSVKPFEIWMGYASGRAQRKASFKTEKAALSSSWWADK
jgi:hypothetical protein